MNRFLRAHALAFRSAILVLALLGGGLLARAETTIYEYDALGRLTKVTGNAKGSLATYVYDAAGNRTQTTLKPESLAPSVPTGLSATLASPTQVSLSWTGSTDTGGSELGGYRIYRNGSQIGTSATTSYTDSSLASATTYAYRVSAYDKAGNESALNRAGFSGGSIL